MRLAIFLAACGMAFGQADSKLTFEVASVKLAGPYVPGMSGGMRGGPGTADPGRITWQRAMLASLLAEAYGVWQDQIVGPEWIKESADVFDVTATMAAGTTREQFRIMLQNMLAERFHVKIHRETQSRAGYDLVVAPGGPKITEWKPPAEVAPSRSGVDANGFPRLPGGSGSTVSMVMSTSNRPAPVRMRMRTTMANFCRGLGSNINASNGIPIGGPQPRVADKTGLTGTYEFSLEFAGIMFRPTTVTPPPPNGDSGAPASDPADGVPTIFAAVEKQLGLKLVKVKDVSVEVIVVDQADKVPTEN